MSEFNMSAWLDGGGERRTYEYPLFKMQEGVTYQVRILDMVPVKRYIHFNSISNRSAVCPGESCLFCAAGTDPAVSQAFVNILDRMDGKVKVLRFGVGKGLGSELAKLFSAEGNPMLYDIRIVRTGLKKDTRYNLARINGEAEPSAEAVKGRHDLENILRPMTLTEMEKFVGVTRVRPSTSPSLPPMAQKVTTFEEGKSELTSISNPGQEEDLPI